MRPDLLDLLRCPHCGGELRIADEPAPVADKEELNSAILACHCNAYPVVAGIPYVRTNARAKEAMGALEESRGEDAIRALLGRDERVALKREGGATTFGKALEEYAPDAEGTYLFYRFSDPGYLSSESLVHGLANEMPGLLTRVLDVGGGAGHLAWSVERRGWTELFTIADISFRKLWLAREFVARNAEAVCCDANWPLPFERDSFTLVHNSDSFHYVWNRRLLAEEMMRTAGSLGTVLLSHLHNATTWNGAEGMPLPPNGYLRLFAAREARVHPQRAIVQAYLNGESVDLDVRRPDHSLLGENALVLVATSSKPPAVVPSRWEPYRDLAVNPLYTRNEQGWQLEFPFAVYLEESSLWMEYLPQSFSADLDEVAARRHGAAGEELRSLADRLALLPLPEDYV